MTTVSANREVDALKRQLAETQAELDKVLVEKHFLEESTRHLNFLHNTHDGVFFTNASGVLTFVNPYLLRTLGYENANELLGRPVPDEIWDNPADKAQLLQDLQQQGFVRERMLTLRHVTGDPVYVSCSAVSVLNPEGNYVGAEVMLCNVTGKRKLETRRLDEIKSLRQHAAAINERLKSGEVDAAKTEVQALVKALDGLL